MAEITELSNLMHLRYINKEIPYTLILGSDIGIPDTVLEDLGFERRPELYDYLSTFSSAEKYALLNSSYKKVSDQGYYEYLALLISKQYFGLVYTTDISCNLEDALTKIGIGPSLYSVLIPRSEMDPHVPTMQFRGLNIIKLRGDLRSKIFNFNLAKLMQKSRTNKNLFSHIFTDIILVGFTDDDWDIASNLHLNTKSIWYVNPRTPQNHSPLIASLSTAAGFHVIDNAAEPPNFFKAIFTALTTDNHPHKLSQDGQGQPQSQAPLQQEISVMPTESIPNSQPIHVSDNNYQTVNAVENMIGNHIIQNNSVEPPKGINSVPKTIDSLSQYQRRARDNYENAVFVSYAWGGESERTVDELDQAFVNRGIRIVRDKKDLEYKGSIEIFEQRIGQGKCIVLVISDKYLRSEHCMYELVKVDENRNLRERIFPIVLADARIYKALDRLTYIKYWDEQIEQLNRAIKEVGIMTNLASITADLDKYARIRSNIDHLTDLLSDMNALTPEQHALHGFSTLIRDVERSLA